MSDAVIITAVDPSDLVTVTASDVSDAITITVSDIVEQVTVTASDVSDSVTVSIASEADQVTVTATDVSDAVTVSVVSADDQVSVSVSNDQGPAGTDYNPATSFHGLLFGGVAGAEIAVTSPAVGTRLTYTYAGGVTRYRFYSADDTQDAFYSDAALTALIVSRYF